MSRASISSVDIAASVEATCIAMAQAMATYQRCADHKRQLRTELLVSVDQLHERLAHELLALCRKCKDEL
jgi:hypothetical protein